MKYYFENRRALDIYITITKDLGINIRPPKDNEFIYLTEKFMLECFEDLLPPQTS